MWNWIRYIRIKSLHGRLSGDKTMTGTVFDIAEGSIHDGPGMRITVFLKGCPLRCRWCHSPEGQSPECEMLRPAGVAPRLCGRVWQSEKLAAFLYKRVVLLENGGVTFSGGEPLMQADFLSEVLTGLPGIHTLIDTCGYAPETKFLLLIRRMSMVFFGLKMLNNEDAIRWTGRDCSPVLRNLLLLDRETEVPYRLRIPFLADVTASDGYLHELEIFCRQLRRADGIDFLPSNPEAGAKYASCAKEFTPGYDPLKKAELPEWFSPGIPFRLFEPVETGG